MLNLSKEDEVSFEGTIDQIAKKVPMEKADFMLLIYPS